MSANVKLPGLGEVKKSTAGLIAAAGVGVVAVIWWRKRQANASSVGTPAADTSSIDPATGFASGSPEDQQALAEQASAGSGLGSFGDGAFFGNGPGTVTGPGGPGGFADNAQWAQYAEQYLTQTVGANAETTGNAIGKYITGQPLTAAQVQVAEQAIAFAGYPPVEGPGGNPPGFRTASGPHPGPKPKAKVKVPDVTGRKYEEAARILAAHHLRARRGEPYVGVIGEQKPAAGAETGRNSTVTLYPAKHRK